MDESQEKFLCKLRNLLADYRAEITAKDHYLGYPENGQDIRMTVEFDDYALEDIDLGTWIDAASYGGKADKP